MPKDQSNTLPELKRIMSSEYGDGVLTCNHQKYPEGPIFYVYIQMETGKPLNVNTTPQVVVCVEVNGTMLPFSYEVVIYTVMVDPQITKLGYRTQLTDNHVKRFKEVVQTFANLNGWPAHQFKDEQNA